jgi:phage baseplate assembly protein gpV
MRFPSLRISVLFLMACATYVTAQDFQQTYRVPAGTQVSVSSVSGDVRVTPHDGDAVVVIGYKEGRDKDQVFIEDSSSGNRISVRDRYPQNCRNCNVSVRFEVKIPRKSQLRYDAFSSVSGNVEVTGASGELHVKSVSGDVTVKDCDATVKASSVSGNVDVGSNEGTVNANSVSGNVNVAIERLSEGGDMKFNSVSGNVAVRVPATLNAEVDMSSMSGALRTDFPITIEKGEFKPNHSARGRIGEGGRRLKINSISGNISLLRHQ